MHTHTCHTCTHAHIHTRVTLAHMHTHTHITHINTHTHPMYLSHALHTAKPLGSTRPCAPTDKVAAPRPMWRMPALITFATGNLECRHTLRPSLRWRQDMHTNPPHAHERAHLLRWNPSMYTCFRTMLLASSLKPCPCHSTCALCTRVMMHLPCACACLPSSCSPCRNWPRCSCQRTQ